MEAKDRIIVALDVDSPHKAKDLVLNLTPHVGCFKIGLQLICTMLRLIATSKKESEAIENLKAIWSLFAVLEGNIMWDGKFDDIPNIVGGASAEIAKIGVKMFNVHASAGKEAIAKAVANKGNSLVLGVTILTSIDKDECLSIFGGWPDRKVADFGLTLSHNKADGIICSAQELKILARHPGTLKLLKVTPGIRPEWAQKGDQKRVMTPGEAIKAGADYLVIGRPITNPPKEIGSPVEAAKKIAEEIAQALKEKGGKQ